MVCAGRLHVTWCVMSLAMMMTLRPWGYWGVCIVIFHATMPIVFMPGGRVVLTSLVSGESAGRCWVGDRTLGLEADVLEMPALC